MPLMLFPGKHPLTCAVVHGTLPQQSSSMEFGLQLDCDPGFWWCMLLPHVLLHFYKAWVFNTRISPCQKSLCCKLAARGMSACAACAVYSAANGSVVLHLHSSGCASCVQSSSHITEMHTLQLVIFLAPFLGHPRAQLQKEHWLTPNPGLSNFGVSGGHMQC